MCRRIWISPSTPRRRRRCRAESRRDTRERLFANHASGIANRHTARRHVDEHDGIRADRRPVADIDAAQDGSPGSDADIVPEGRSFSTRSARPYGHVVMKSDVIAQNGPLMDDQPSSAMWKVKALAHCRLGRQLHAKNEPKHQLMKLAETS